MLRNLVSVVGMYANFISWKACNPFFLVISCFPTDCTIITVCCTCGKEIICAVWLMAIINNDSDFWLRKYDNNSGETRNFLARALSQFLTAAKWSRNHVRHRDMYRQNINGTCAHVGVRFIFFSRGSLRQWNDSLSVWDFSFSFTFLLRWWRSLTKMNRWTTTTRA